MYYLSYQKANNYYLINCLRNKTMRLFIALDEYNSLAVSLIFLIISALSYLLKDMALLTPFNKSSFSEESSQITPSEKFCLSLLFLTEIVIELEPK